VARVTDDRTFAKLKVRFAPAVLSFLPFVWGDYWILGLASDYSWATVGSPDRTYLWILARTPTPDAGRFASALAAVRANGFDVERLTKTIHTGADQADKAEIRSRVERIVIGSLSARGDSLRRPGSISS
jgi:lipocalin